MVDLSHVRSRFPALSREQDGRPVVFVDARGGSHVPETVIQAIGGYLRSSNANTHGAFATSEETDLVIAEAHRAAADLLHADPDEVVFARFDHDANVRPWILAAEDAGASVRWVDLRDEDVTLDVASLEAALSGRTKVVAFSLASNAVGSVTPAADLVRLIRERAPEALVCVDGVHLAQHRSVNVHSIGADVAVCSPYKIFGPHLGIMFGRRELLTSLRPYKLRPASDEIPYRWETGTQNHEGFAGFVAAMDYLAGLTQAAGSRRERIAAAFRDAIVPWEAELSRRFLAGVVSLTHVRLFGIAHAARVDERTPTFAVRVEEQHPLETAKGLAERGIYVWDGHYYAIELMERLGLLETGGAVRIGFCHYNTPDEVDRVLQALASLP